MHKFPSARLARPRLCLTLLIMNAIAYFGLALTQSAPLTATRPVAVWPSGPLDVVAAFDEALNLATATSLVGQSIPYFESEGLADHRAASRRPLGLLRIVGARLTDDGRTLTLATDPHPRPALYVLPLPATAGNHGRKGSAAGETQLSPFRCRGRLEPGRQPRRSARLDRMVAAN